MLRAFPAAAELYETNHYDRSGLSRTPLELSIGTEMLAAQVIRRVSASDWKPRAD